MCQRKATARHLQPSTRLALQFTDCRSVATAAASRLCCNVFYTCYLLKELSSICWYFKLEFATSLSPSLTCLETVKPAIKCVLKQVNPGCSSSCLVRSMAFFKTNWNRRREKTISKYQAASWYFQLQWQHNKHWRWLQKYTAAQNSIHKTRREHKTVNDRIATGRLHTVTYVPIISLLQLHNVVERHSKH